MTDKKDKRQLVKQTPREKKLGCKSLFVVPEISITLKDLVDVLNEGKKRGDEGFIEHNKAMKKVESLMALNEGFGSVEILDNVISTSNGGTQTIKTIKLNKLQCITFLMGLSPSLRVKAATLICDIDNIIEDSISLAMRDIKQETERQKENEVVYFVKAGDFIKIGYTCDVQARMSQIQTSNPNEVDLLFTVKTDDARKLEQDLHNKYRKQNVRGEWFQLTQEQLLSYRNDYCPK